MRKASFGSAREVHHERAMIVIFQSNIQPRMNTDQTRISEGFERIVLFKPCFIRGQFAFHIRVA
jgi:hypothetical protein